MKNKTKQISLTEYAEKINPALFRRNRKYPNNKITPQAIKYRIKNKMELPQVYQYTQVGKVHVLTVKKNF